MFYKQERFAGIKFAILCVLVQFLKIPILRSDAMQVVFINECKSCEISNQMFFNAIFPFSKTKDELVVT